MPVTARRRIAALTLPLLLVFAAVAFAVLTPTGTAKVATVEGQAPVLLLADPTDPFGRYYAEILLAEGVNAYDVADVGDLSAEELSGRSVVLLANATLTDTQVSTLTTWVGDGGNLIAMRPDAKLAGLLGLGTRSGTVAEGYVTADPSVGITTEAVQFHGTADRWSVEGATSLARLGATAAETTTEPAVTSRAVGVRGGEAAAFTFDLARSVVYTRQGNPAWAGQERDFAIERTGQDPVIRPDDMFYAPPGGADRSWVDFSRIQIPQADELQRLLANLVVRMSRDRVPLPRFWYLPRGLKAAVVMTGDDHAAGGTVGHFEKLLALSPEGCSNATWTCLRSTSYVFPSPAMTDAQIKRYQDLGFELALHVATKPPFGCQNFTESGLRDLWRTQSATIRAIWPSIAASRTSRAHCVVWSDWASHARVEREFGVRLDTNYYYWPADWVNKRPGLFTGSGLPMRFADLDGTTLDVYQATTQITDESGINATGTDNTYTQHIDTLLDNALGPKGYYAVVTANMHTDLLTHAGLDAIVASAIAKNVPVISAQQLLDWLDVRNGARFEDIAYAPDGTLRFAITAPDGMPGLRAMLPVDGPRGKLLTLSRDGVEVSTEAQTAKGIEYATFDAAPGSYTATYTVPPDPHAHAYSHAHAYPHAHAHRHACAYDHAARDACRHGGAVRYRDAKRDRHQAARQRRTRSGDGEHHPVEGARHTQRHRHAQGRLFRVHGQARGPAPAARRGCRGRRSIGHGGPAANPHRQALARSQDTANARAQTLAGHPGHRCEYAVRAAGHRQSDRSPHRSALARKKARADSVC